MPQLTPPQFVAFGWAKKVQVACKFCKASFYYICQQLTCRHISTSPLYSQEGRGEGVEEGVVSGGAQASRLDPGRVAWQLRRVGWELYEAQFKDPIVKICIHSSCSDLFLKHKTTVQYFGIITQGKNYWSIVTVYILHSPSALGCLDVTSKFTTSTVTF
jgi:hypothetical protein